MRRIFLWGVIAALLATTVGVALVSAQPSEESVFNDVISAAAYWANHGGLPRPGDAGAALDGSEGAYSPEDVDVDGTFWSNGPYNGVNAFSSEINTFGFITNRTADDFLIGGGGSRPLPFNVCLIPNISQARASLLQFDSTAVLEIWRDGKAAAGCGVPSAAGPCNDPLPLVPGVGFPYANPFLSSSNTQIGTSFGFPVREHAWNFTPLLTLPPGKFWLMAAGFNGVQSQTFWGLSNGGRDGMGTEFAYQRGYFGGANWSQTAGQNNFAFDIDSMGCALRLTGQLEGGAPVPPDDDDDDVSGLNTNDTGVTLAMSVADDAAAPQGLPMVPQQVSGTDRYCLTGQATVIFTVTSSSGFINFAGSDEFTAVFGPGVNLLGCTVTGSNVASTCSASGSTAVANFGLAPNTTATIRIDLQSVGGIQNQTVPITITLRVGTAAGQTTPTTIVFNTSTGDALQCRNTVDPNRQLGCQVHLPILNFQGEDDVCRTWIEVQAVGCDMVKAVLITWGEPGFCPPQAAGPLKVECTGLLKPGSTWNLLGAQIPTGSKSGILFKFTARQLSEIGVDLGFDDVVADLMCETLFFGVVGDADDYRRFKKAYNEGLEFAGVPLDLAMGDGFLAVDVLRHCPGDVTPGVEVSGKYNGIAGTHLGTYDPVFGGFGYYVPLLYADKAGFNSVMYIQNGGLECSSIEIWFKAQDDCLRARICEVFTLAPGESFQWDATNCVGPDWQGSAWLRSSQPLGIAVDIIGRDVMMTYIAEPSEINYSFDPTTPYVTEGDQVAYGPLIYSEYQGWDTGIQVQNLSPVVNAKVKVYFLDRSGDIITTLVDWICPRGSQTFFLPVVADLPGTWVGSVRVESQEWFTPGGPVVSPPNVVGVVTLIKYNDAARTETSEAIAYNLLPEHKLYDWQLGFGGGGLSSGIGLIAIPSLLKDLDGTGVTSELAIANIVPKPGFTDFAIFIFDQNGLLDYVCQKLNEKQVEYIDLQTWGYLNPGFKGSALISATFWEHDVFGPNGAFLRNLVGLGAVIVERTGTRLGEDVPGDESAGARGIPFTLAQLETNFCPFFMLGPVAPLCPGLPDLRPDDGCPIVRQVFGCIDCPIAIADVSTVRSTLPVSVPSGCEIDDVNVWVSLTHTFISDIRLTLTPPVTTGVGVITLIGVGICGGTSGNINAIFDDEATAVIGVLPGGCLPLIEDFVRWRNNPNAIPFLQTLEGTNPNGTWFLTVTDAVATDVGTLNYWELQFEYR
jgi:hypothetical protein